MEITDIRLTNVDAIIKAKFDGKKSRFADSIDKYSNYVSTWWTKNPTRKRNIGHNIAREIEVKLGLEKGWLDVQHNDHSDLETDPYKKLLTKIDSGERYKILLKERAILEQQKLVLTLLNETTTGEIMFLSTDKEAWGIVLIGNHPNSMLNKGWGIIVEPNTPITVNEYVLVTRKNGEILLRELTHNSESEIILTNPITSEQNRLPWDDITKAEYCYIGIPPSKIIQDKQE